MNKTIEEIRNETDANIYIDRAIAMLKEKCEGEYLVAGYNGIVSLLQYAKESHQFQQKQKQDAGVPAHSGDELKPEIVCLCGSTRFAKWFMIKRWELEKKGLITLGINILPDNYFAEGNSHGAEQENVKDILDELHKRKIDICDKVFILNVGGYIGESTRNEIDYALSIGKPIEYLEYITT